MSQRLQAKPRRTVESQSHRPPAPTLGEWDTRGADEWGFDFDPELRFSRPRGLVVESGRVVVIKDETLREGEETPGVRATTEGRLEVARALARAGIKETEIGYPAARAADRDLADAIRAEGLDLRLGAHIRGWVKDVKSELDVALEHGADVLNIVQVASEPELARAPWLVREDVPLRTAEAVEYGRSLGATVSVGFISVLRMQSDFTRACYQHAADAGADRLYVYDGGGNATPEVVARLVYEIAAVARPATSLAFHGHNDFGLAVANSIAAVRAGASVVDCVVAGLGDRAGNTALEVFVVACEALYDIRTGVDVSRLMELAQTVATVYEVPLHQCAPIVGENCFRHSTDSHVEAILGGHGYLYEPVNPGAVGATRRVELDDTLRFDPSTGAFAKLLRVLGLCTDDESYGHAFAIIEAAIAQRGQLTIEEAALLLEDLHGGIE